MIAMSKMDSETGSRNAGGRVPWAEPTGALPGERFSKPPHGYTTRAVDHSAPSLCSLPSKPGHVTPLTDGDPRHPTPS
jgi:hypothetical protein